MQFHISPFDAIRSKTKLKIVRFLLTHNASMSEREIASVLKISHMSVNRTLRELADVHFVDFITVGKAHLWKVNRKSYAFKALFHLVKGASRARDPLNDLREKLLARLPKTGLKKMVLFGSVAEGSERPDSDIDVFFLIKNEKNRKKLEAAVEKLSLECLETYGNRLAPYILTEQEVRRRKDLKIMSEIHEGMQLFPPIQKEQ